MNRLFPSFYKCPSGKELGLPITLALLSKEATHGGSYDDLDDAPDGDWYDEVGEFFRDWEFLPYFFSVRPVFGSFYLGRCSE